jgi:polyadenylate-binding protein
MRDSNGVSRGSGFVAFKSAEDANRAVCCFVMCLVILI